MNKGKYKYLIEPEGLVMPDYPPWKHLPDFRKALYWFIMALHRRDDYKELREKNIFLPCAIEGAAFRIRELEWIFRGLTRKVKVTKIYQNPIGIQLGDPEVRIIDPVEANRTVKSGYDSKFPCVSFHPGEPIELSLKQVEKIMLHEHHKYFKQHPNVNEEMYLKKRGPKGRFVRFDFDALEISFQIFDLKNPPLELSASEIALILGNQKNIELDISTINKKAKSVDRLRKYSLNAKTLSDFLTQI